MKYLEGRVWVGNLGGEVGGGVLGRRFKCKDLTGEISTIYFILKWKGTVGVLWSSVLILEF